MRVEMGLVKLPQFFQSRTGDRGQPEQKGKARGFLAGEIPEERRRQCRARSRYAWDQGTGLRKPDDYRILQRRVFEGALRP